MTLRPREVDLGALDEFSEGMITLRTVAGREFCVIRSGEQVYVVSNRCPHQGAAMCHGHLQTGYQGDLAPYPRPRVDSHRPVLACAWHGWEFYVDSGEAVWSTKYRMRTYMARVHEGRVLVTMRARRAPAGAISGPAAQ